MSLQCPLCGKDKTEEALFCTDCEKKIRTEYEIDLPGSRSEKGVPLPGDEAVADGSPYLNERLVPDEVPFYNRKPVADDKSGAESAKFQNERPGADDILALSALSVVKETEITESVEGGDNRGDMSKADYDDKVEPTPPPRKKKTGMPVLWIVLAAVLLVGAFYVYNETIRNEKLDQSSWEAALKVNSVEGYLAYMSVQPDGAHFEEAQAKLRSLKAEEAAVWEKLKTTDNISALRDFLLQHPESPYASLVGIRLDSLSWVNAVKTNTAAAYSDYIIGVESGELNGDYRTLAEERYEMLFQAYPVNEAELDSIRWAVNGFYAALSTVDQDGIIPYFAPVVDRFFTSGRVTRERIAGELLTAVTRTQDTTLQFTPNLNGVQYEKTLSDAYIVNVPLTKSYVKGEIVEQIHGYIAHLTLNSLFQIISIYETKPYPGAP